MQLRTVLILLLLIQLEEGSMKSISNSKSKAKLQGGDRTVNVHMKPRLVPISFQCGMGSIFDEAKQMCLEYKPDERIEIEPRRMTSRKEETIDPQTGEEIDESAEPSDEQPEIEIVSTHCGIGHKYNSDKRICERTDI